MAPGPGAYNHQSSLENLNKFSFTEKRLPRLGNDNPGPGRYGRDTDDSNSPDKGSTYSFSKG